MIANYHTHTPRCNHATGSEAEYVRAAMDAGIQILGFSDHTPYFFPGDYYSHFRMRPEQFPDYCEAVRRVQKEYAGQIQIHLGVECEYYPKHFSDVLSLLRDHQVEYMILGQHFINNEYDGPYSGVHTDREADFRTYAHQAMDAMNTGLFTYFAHPDLAHFQVPDRVYLDYMRQICREAKSCGIPVEINLLGYREHKWYPNPLLYEAAALEDCPVIIGCDAHAPEVFGDQETENRARSLIQTYGLKLLDTVELRKI